VSSRNIDAIVDRVLAREGGIADVGDGQGTTFFGQTSAWLADFGLPVPTTRDQAAANYRRWLALTRLDQVCDRDLELGDTVVDFAVNAGVSRAVRGLQSALGVVTDGVVGPNTLAALATADPFGLRCLVIADRIDLLGDYFHDPSHATFSRGLHHRVSALVRDLGAPQ
jgi:lysozyme family protein